MIGWMGEGCFCFPLCHGGQAEGYFTEFGDNDFLLSREQKVNEHSADHAEEWCDSGLFCTEPVMTGYFCSFEVSVIHIYHCTLL